MQPAPLGPELSAATPIIAARLGVILRGLMALIASAFLKEPRHVALINPLWSYINRTLRRFDRLMGRLTAGTLRAAKPRPGSKPGRAPVKLPRTRAWLVVNLGHHAAGFASQLDHLLNDPEAAAIIAATPQAQRLLRPLCHLLGIQPECLKGEGGAAPRTTDSKPPGSPPPGLPEGGWREGGATRRTPPRSPDPDLEPAFSPRPAPFICPRLLTRWPWSAMKKPA